MVQLIGTRPRRTLATSLFPNRTKVCGFWNFASLLHQHNHSSRSAINGRPMFAVQPRLSLTGGSRSVYNRHNPDSAPGRILWRVLDVGKRETCACRPDFPLGAVYNSNPPRCVLRPAVAHQTTPSPVGEGRGGGSKQAALATVYKTNCKQPARQRWGKSRPTGYIQDSGEGVCKTGGRAGLACHPASTRRAASTPQYAASSNTE